MLNFDVYVKAGATARATAEPNTRCIPRRLVVPGSISDHFNIGYILVGRYNTFLNATPVSAELFSDDACVKCHGEDEVDDRAHLEPSMQLDAHGFAKVRPDPSHPSVRELAAAMREAAAELESGKASWPDTAHAVARSLRLAVELYERDTPKAP